MAQCSDCGQQLSRFKQNGGHMSTCPQVTGAVRDRGKNSGSGEHSNHTYGRWRGWFCMGTISGQDVNTRYCITIVKGKPCGAKDETFRKCTHGKKPPR